MAKKTSRPNIPESTLERARREMERDAGSPPPVAETPAPSGEVAARTYRAPRMSSADLRSEYQYVVNDLRNMGILAAVFLGVLIALSVFI